MPQSSKKKSSKKAAPKKMDMKPAADAPKS